MVGKLETGFIFFLQPSCLLILSTAELSIHVDNTNEEQNLSLAVDTAFGLLLQVTLLFLGVQVIPIYPRFVSVDGVFNTKQSSFRLPASQMQGSTD